MANTWNKAGTTWGYNSWESDTVTVSLTGISITSTLNSDGVVAFNEQGWGSDAWGDENWGESAISIPVTGILGFTCIEFLVKLIPHTTGNNKRNDQR